MNRVLTEGRRMLPASLRLLRIEFRRSVALFFFPILVAAAGWLAYEYLPDRIALWNASAHAARQTLLFLGPLVAGLGAWMAGRNRWSRMEELLATTPLSPSLRDLITWAGTALWGIVAYGVVVLVLVIITYLGATWGAPPLAWLREGLLALVAYSAIGYAVGYYTQNRFVVPVVPVALYVAQIAPTYFKSSVQYLTAISSGSRWPSVFYSATPPFHWARAGWFLGLAAIAIVVVVLRHRQTSLTWGALAAAFLLTILSATTLLRLELGAEEAQHVPYEPLCQKGVVITVCTHPAYQVMLRPVAEVVNHVAMPLAGVPGAPTRAEQRPTLFAPHPERLLPFTLLPNGRSSDDRGLARQIADSLVVRDRTAACEGWERTRGEACFNLTTDPAEEAQGVIADWLYAQAGYPLCVPIGDGVFQCKQRVHSPKGRAVRARFMALDATQQRDWLVDHFADLRAGKLTLEDLP